MRLAHTLLLGALVLAPALVPATASAKKGSEGDPEGVPVKVKVLDADGNPIPTAVVRHPDEADRHRVNSPTGEWFNSVLYLPDGSEMIFTPGMQLRLEISAPGYMTKIIQYDIRKRKNNIEVALDKLEIEEQSIEEPTIQFGRDKPRDDGGSGPAN
jgi:hypothetical protein